MVKFHFFFHVLFPTPRGACTINLKSSLGCSNILEKVCNRKVYLERIEKQSGWSFVPNLGGIGRSYRHYS